MSTYRLFPEPERRLEEIVDYTRGRWGAEQAIRYLDGAVACFKAITARESIWRRIAPELGVDGYFCRYAKHLVYWKTISEVVAITTLLHERMHQAALVRDAFNQAGPQTSPTAAAPEVTEVAPPLIGSAVLADR